MHAPPADRLVPGVLRLDAPRAPRRPLVFDSPHSGTDMPDGFRPAAPRELVLMATDTHVDALFAFAPDIGAPLLSALYPRSFMDANRSLADMDPALVDGPWPGPLRESPTVARGMGLIWRYAWGDTPMYAGPLAVAEAQDRIERYWRPYHEALAGLVAEARAAFGAVWHVDCHSMPAVGHALSPDPPGTVRPDFVLGDRDGTSCEPGFVDMVHGALEGMGYRVARNDPFKGAELTSAYSDPADGRNSLQIEINRRLYMDEGTRARTAGFRRLAADLRRLGEAMAAYVDAKRPA
jgi:N-formylglutamate deformylase